MQFNPTLAQLEILDECRHMTVTAMAARLGIHRTILAAFFARLAAVREVAAIVAEPFVEPVKPVKPDKVWSWDQKREAADRRFADRIFEREPEAEAVPIDESKLALHRLNAHLAKQLAKAG